MNRAKIVDAIDEADREIADMMRKYTVESPYVSLTVRALLAAMVRIGRDSIIEDFEAMCAADGMIGFTNEEWAAIKKFFEWNRSLTNVT